MITRDEFCEEFRQYVEVMELTDDFLAKSLQISRPTVARWKNGEAAPHEVGRQPVLDWLRKLYFEFDK